MKATQVQPEPAALDVTLTMTEEEATLLWRLSLLDIRIPELFDDEPTPSSREIYTLLQSINKTLRPVVAP